MKGLVVVDLQKDFCEGGSLAVKGGNDTAQKISTYIRDFGGDYEFIIGTKDFHIDPKEHFSNEPDYRHTWPVHCVAGQPGSDYHPAISGLIDETFVKGLQTAAYSGFEAFSLKKYITLKHFIKRSGVDELDICGLAYDYCVGATAADAVREGYKTNVLIDLTAYVDINSANEMTEALAYAGVDLFGEY